MGERTVILGISCFYHDSAAALIVDGVVVAAAQEEWFSRKKHDSDFPLRAIDFCLRQTGLSIRDVLYVVFYEKPLLKLERLLKTYIAVWPRGLRSFLTAVPPWIAHKMWIEYIIRKELGFEKEVLFTEHHYAHAASAYFCSSFDSASIVTMDGVGEWDTTTIGHAEGSSIVLTHAIAFPHSLGLLYSTITSYLGFAVNSDEYKVMGLAPYGDPSTYYSAFKKLVEWREDGSFRLDMRYFAYEYGLTMTSPRLNELLGGPSRRAEEPIGQREKDIAAALQKVTEEIVLSIAAYAAKTHSNRNVCLAGGVALNCVANGRLLRSRLFDNIYIQPAAGDAGGAVGAALFVHYAVLKHPKKGAAMRNAFLGPAYSDDEIERILMTKQRGSAVPFTFTKLEEKSLIEKTARLLAENAIVGWFQGGMEYGPRALGNRSILADPRFKNNWPRINRDVKFREDFRPFAPSVLEENARECFDLSCESPYMLFTAPVLTDSIPAVTHVDGSARIQTVNRQQNAKFYRLLEAFRRCSGCPVLLNTSLNAHNEPIAMAPEHALRCFLETAMDYLVLGNILVEKRPRTGE